MPCLATSTSDSDPNSKNGLMTKVWGPAGWLFLHCVTFGYPENPDLYDSEYGLPPGTTRSRYRRFFTEVGNVLPCRYCRDSYKEFIKEDRVEDHIQDRNQLIEWFWRIHNKVNQKLGVHYCDATIEEIKEKYETYRAKCKAPTSVEIQANSEKGCVIPADGTPKKCLIDIVKTNKGDVTRRDNALTHSDDGDLVDKQIISPDQVIQFAIYLFIFSLALYLGYIIGRRCGKKLLKIKK